MAAHYILIRSLIRSFMHRHIISRASQVVIDVAISVFLYNSAVHREYSAMLAGETLRGRLLLRV